MSKRKREYDNSIISMIYKISTFRDETQPIFVSKEFDSYLYQGQHKGEKVSIVEIIGLSSVAKTIKSHSHRIKEVYVLDKTYERLNGESFKSAKTVNYIIMDYVEGESMLFCAPLWKTKSVSFLQSVFQKFITSIV